MIPSTLKIGGHNIKVIYPYNFKERSDTNGQYDKNLCEIRIAGVDTCGNTIVESELWVTLLHEILHAIDYVSGHRMFCGEDGEAKIEGLSEGLYQVLNDNGLLKRG
jgi:hypothetical protein